MFDTTFTLEADDLNDSGKQKVLDVYLASLPSSIRASFSVKEVVWPSPVLMCDMVTPLALTLEVGERRVRYVDGVRDD